MIIYFTGTGNSKFVADYLADKLNDTVVSMNEILKNKGKLVCESHTPYIIVAPIYAWRLPNAVEELLKNTELLGNKNVYCVATMGENSGNADKYIEKIITDKEMNFTGFIGVPMQNNYLLMDKMPDTETVYKQIYSIIPKLDTIVSKIKNSEKLYKDDKTPLPSLMSGLINWGFNNFMLKNQKYTVNSSCMLCGNCVSLCPTGNISIVENNISFDTNCMACFACLHICPTQAINIAGKTEDKGRYICPDYATLKNENL